MNKDSLKTKKSGAMEQLWKTVKHKQEDLRISKLRERLALKPDQNIHFYEDIVETIHETLVMLDSYPRILHDNQSFHITFAVALRESIKNRDYFYDKNAAYTCEKIFKTGNFKFEYH